MTAYESYVINYSGTFPATIAVNATGAGATNGTPLLAGILNDEWGFWQQALLMVQQTPNGTGEAAAVAYNSALGTGQQKMGALQMLFRAPGELVFDAIVPGSGTYGTQSMVWGAASGGPPARYQYRRVIPCNGQMVLAASYPDLCAALYCGDANNPAATHCYYSSDSAGTTHSTSAKTYFNLPDFRGVTVRGVDPGAVHDPLGATRGGFGGEIASLQQDAFQGHRHTPLIGTTYVTQGSGSTTYTSGSGSYSVASGSTGDSITDGTNGTPRTGTETRMYNASCNISVAF